MLSANNVSPLPFLKWAGGKRWLVDKHRELLSTDFDRLIEPFVGGGAVFFGLSPKSAILCDKNPKLIETYIAVRDDWERVEAKLREHHRKHSEEYYYFMRSQKTRTLTTRAAQFIYLNRTCWNGLYRVNKNGDFNVPIGTKKSVILDSDNFELISNQLRSAKLIFGDFEIAIDQAGLGDLVFADPPYTVKHNYNGFVKYNENIFSWNDQVRLRDSVRKAINRGAKVIITNACHDSVKELYKGIGEITTVSRPSVIAGKSFARGRYEEVVVKCF